MKKERELGEYINENSPPASPLQESEENMQVRNRQMDKKEKKDMRGSKRKKELRKCRKKYKEKIKVLEEEVENQKWLANQWKVKHFRLSSLLKSNRSPSPNFKVNAILRKGKDTVRKNLLWGRL